MRVGLLGDVHAEDRAVAEALRRFEQARVDLVLCTGDVVDGPGDVERAIALLCEAGVRTVRGNHERWLFEGSMRTLPGAHHLKDLSADATRWLAQLPRTVALTTRRGALVLGHGLGADDMAPLPDGEGPALDPAVGALAARGVEWLVGGHTHRRMFRRSGGIALVNAGALVAEDDPCASILDLDEGRLAYFGLPDGRPLESFDAGASVFPW